MECVLARVCVGPHVPLPHSQSRRIVCPPSPPPPKHTTHTHFHPILSGALMFRGGPCQIFLLGHALS
jgi:hypothetical protein